MTALTMDTLRRKRGHGYRQEIAIGTSSRVYHHSLLAQVLSTKRVVAATAATGRRIAGICVGFKGPVAVPSDGKGGATGNTAGTIKAIVEWGNEWEFTIATAVRTSTNLLLNHFISDDNTLAGTAVGTAGKQVPVGMLTEYTSSDESTAYVAIKRFYTTNIAT